MQSILKNPPPSFLPYEMTYEPPCKKRKFPGSKTTKSSGTNFGPEGGVGKRRYKLENDGNGIYQKPSNTIMNLHSMNTAKVEIPKLFRKVDRPNLEITVNTKNLQGA